MKKIMLIILIIMFLPALSLGQNNQDNVSNSENDNQELNDIDSDIVSNEEEIDNTETLDEMPVVFWQKGGMLESGDHSIYIRTNDEWTSFSTFMVGYRYAVNDSFNIALEIGASPIPHVYLGGLLFHFKMLESSDRTFFMGLRTRMGYKYMDLNLNNFGDGFQNYLVVQRNGLYFAADFTFAFRFGNKKQFSLYYSFYPRFDVDLFTDQYTVFFMFSPVMIGFEVRWGKEQRWSFAIESGYTFPIPWDHIPENYWPNFPSLANMSLNYRF